MKGLFSVIGLIAALFVSNVHATSIYDTSSSVSPKFESNEFWSCVVDSIGPPLSGKVSESNCASYLMSLKPEEYPAGSNRRYYDCSPKPRVSDTIPVKCSVNRNYGTENNPDWRPYGEFQIGRAINPEVVETRTCPPDEFILYSFGYDQDLDGKYDKCFNPAELDNASNCAAAFNSGRILTATSSSPATVCKTDDNGSKCAYSRVDQGGTPYFQPNLEIGCFGDGNEIPDYDKPDTQQPQPEQCTPYGQGFACAADPSKYCDTSGVCVDGCGYVNGQFICFRDDECTGDSCQPAPVNCDNTPTAPICKDAPPDICRTNPSDPSCPNPDPDPEPCTGDNCSPNGGGGGSDFVLDYERLGNLMKDAAKLLIDDNDMPSPESEKNKLDAELKKSLDEEKKIFDSTAFDDYKSSFDGSVFDSLKTMFPPVGNCSPIDFSVFVIDVCPAADIIRVILANFLYGLTAFYIFTVFTNRFTRSKK
jgi:hypothetical protein